VSFFGELYLRSTLPFLSEEVTGQEVDYLARAFKDCSGLLGDIGCGHGRHAAGLAERGFQVIGLELDPLSLKQRLGGFLAVRADFSALPLRAASLQGAYAWYSTLFIHEDDAVHLDLLRQLRRALRPGGRLVIHTVPQERVAAIPSAHFSTQLPDGSLLTEESRFDASSGRDRGGRCMTLPDGRVLSAGYAIRYYRLPEFERLLEAAGLAIRWVHGDLMGGLVGPASTDLIIGAECADG